MEMRRLLEGSKIKQKDIDSMKRKARNLIYAPYYEKPYWLIKLWGKVVEQDKARNRIRELEMGMIMSGGFQVYIPCKELENRAIEEVALLLFCAKEHREGEFSINLSKILDEYEDEMKTYNLLRERLQEKEDAVNFVRSLKNIITAHLENQKETK